MTAPHVCWAVECLRDIIHAHRSGGEVGFWVDVAEQEWNDPDISGMTADPNGEPLPEHGSVTATIEVELPEERA